MMDNMYTLYFIYKFTTISKYFYIYNIIHTTEFSFQNGERNYFD